MEFRGVYTLFCIVILTVCVSQRALALPRISSVVADEFEQPEKVTSDMFTTQDKTETEPLRTVPASTGNNIYSGVTIHRVPCNFEEPNEDVVCQEHCLPKGYSYGICVNFTCSCI